MRYRKLRFHYQFLLPSLALLASLAANSPAQQVTLDQSKLIDGLAERNLRELLLHLADTGDFDDPTEPRLIEIGQYRIDYQNTDKPVDQRIEAFNQAREALQNLIDNPQFADHPQRPVWRTDLTEMLLVTYLEGFMRAANGFYEFGVPTAEQAAAYDDAAAEALRQMLRADAEFADLDTRLAQNPAERQRLEQSQAYYRIFDDYRDRKSAFFGGEAMHYGALLPDSHPYFQNLGDIPGQRQNPAEERRRLRAFAVQKLEPVAAGEIQGKGLSTRARSVAGRATLYAGDPQDAKLRFLDEAVKSTDWSLDLLGAHIAEALVAQAQKRTAEAEATLDQLANDSTVRRNLLFRLLVTDALHKLLLEQAASVSGAGRDAAMSEAYQVYFAMLDDPSLADQAEGLRNLVFDRWASSVQPGEDVSKLPPAVRMAIADISRRKGLVALQGGDQAEAEAMLQRSLDAGRTLSDPAAVGEAVWANGQYNAAFSLYVLNQQSLPKVLEATEMAIEVAEKAPTQPAATDAIGFAAAVLEPWHREPQARQAVQPLFDRAMAVLYGGSFDATKPADDRLVYYAFTTYQAAGDYRRAADLYARQLPSHPNYLEAKALQLFSLTQLLAQSSGSDADALRDELRRVADEAEADARRAQSSGSDPAQQASAERALANARLARAEVAASTGDVAGALDALDGFEQQFANNPELVRSGLQRRILLLVDAERLDEAKEAGSQMMQRFPDAAAGVINSVLNNLESQIDTLNATAEDPGVAESAKQTARGEASRLADTAAAMARLLVDWAGQQDFDAEAMLPYHLVYLKSLRVAEQPAEALTYLRENNLAEQWGNNADVLYEQALALIATGDAANRRAASGLLNKVISNLAEPYPPLYWEAWAARLNLNLLLGENIDEVVRRVSQLQNRFPDLGGEPYKSRLLDLQARAQGRL